MRVIIGMTKNDSRSTSHEKADISALYIITVFSPSQYVRSPAGSKRLFGVYSLSFSHATHNSTATNDCLQPACLPPLGRGGRPLLHGLWAASMFFLPLPHFAFYAKSSCTSLLLACNIISWAVGAWRRQRRRRGRMVWVWYIVAVATWWRRRTATLGGGHGGRVGGDGATLPIKLSASA